MSEGWDVEMYLPRKDTYVMVRPAFYNEAARPRVVRKGKQGFNIYAKSTDGHIGIIAQCTELWEHTPQERVEMLENLRMLCDMQMGVADVDRN
jgi:hypothetical protein